MISLFVLCVCLWVFMSNTPTMLYHDKDTDIEYLQRHAMHYDKGKFQTINESWVQFNKTYKSVLKNYNPDEFIKLIGLRNALLNTTTSYYVSSSYFLQNKRFKNCIKNLQKKMDHKFRILKNKHGDSVSYNTPQPWNLESSLDIYI